MLRETKIKRGTPVVAMKCCGEACCCGVGVVC